MLNILSCRSLRKQKKQEVLSLTFPCPSPLKHVMKPSRKSCPLCTQRKGTSLFPRQLDIEKHPNEQALLSFPSLRDLTHTLCLIISFRGFPLFIKPSIKHTGLTFFSLYIHFLRKAFVPCKTSIKHVYSFFLFICL